jgi:hypothetical protein
MVAATVLGTGQKRGTVAAAISAVKKKNRFNPYCASRRLRRIATKPKAVAPRKTARGCPSRPKVGRVEDFNRL